MPNEHDGNFLGWDIDELTAKPAENVIPFTLEAQVVKAPPPPRPQHPREEQYPWTPDEDERFRLGAFKRSWQGMPLRKEWNNSPIHSDGIMCKSCGYKFPKHLIESDGACWNCWMRDNKPEEMARILAAADRLAGERKEQKHGETAPAKLVKIGESREK